MENFHAPIIEFSWSSYHRDVCVASRSGKEWTTRLWSALTSEERRWARLFGLDPLGVLRRLAPEAA